MKSCMNKQHIKYFSAIMLLSLILFAVGCTENRTQNPTGNTVVQTKEPIRIGVIAPLSGEAASYGLAAKQGLDFAAQEINNKDGVNGRLIELHYEDSQADKTSAVNIMNKYLNIDKYNIIIVADGSSATMAVAPFANRYKIVMIGTLGSTPALKDAGDYFFRTIPSDAAQGAAIAQLADSKGKTAAVLYANDAYGKGIDEIFKKKYSGKVVAEETFTNGAKDFRTQLIKIKDTKPDTIILVVREELPDLLKQMKELKINATLIGSETIKNENTINASGKNTEGLYTLYYAQTTDYQNYKTNYQKNMEKNLQPIVIIHMMVLHY